MKYEDVLKYWGKDLLEKENPGYEIDLDSVWVEIETDPGYQCCGPGNGWDSGCYCSMAESPSSFINVTGRSPSGSYFSKSLSKYMDFVDVIRELDQTAGRLCG